MKLTTHSFSRRSTKNLRFYLIVLILLLGLILLIKRGGVFTNLFSRDYYTEFTYPLEGDVSKYIQQLRQGLKPDVEPINTYDYQFLLFNKSKCLNSKENDDKITLLILVKSAMSHRANRGAIRRTWGQENRFPDIEIRTAFLVGISTNENSHSAIEIEHQKYGDIIQSEFIDTYYNNTVKTMQGFRWVVDKCSNSEFVLFSDDDMYISIKNLLTIIREFKSQNEKKYLFVGSVFRVAPIRSEFSKWYISLEEYPFSNYPPFVNAGAFLLSYETLLELFYGSMYTKHLRFDDVYLGLVANKVNINLTNNDHFHNWKLGYSKLRYQPVIACHGYDDPMGLIRVWHEQNSLNFA